MKIAPEDPRIRAALDLLAELVATRVLGRVHVQTPEATEHGPATASGAGAAVVPLLRARPPGRKRKRAQGRQTQDAHGG